GRYRTAVERVVWLVIRVGFSCSNNQQWVVGSETLHLVGSFLLLILDKFYKTLYKHKTKPLCGLSKTFNYWFLTFNLKRGLNAA
ncbi:hypothetical protein, partial [Hydrogenimonas sp.]|uniref:hypothetical protein n=1 Tax=Hydrogenimonas sp. TaxID=2231112 RepID=UPI00260504CC